MKDIGPFQYDWDDARWYEGPYTDGRQYVILPRGGQWALVQNTDFQTPWAAEPTLFLGPTPEACYVAYKVISAT